MINFDPFVWKSEPPEGIPFKQSQEFKGVKFLGKAAHHWTGDTWYPSWASDDLLYSPVTDDGKGINSSGYSCNVGFPETEDILNKANTGNGILKGDDPLNLEIILLEKCYADPYPYGGRYPCGSLVHNGIWYYGTYLKSPYGRTNYGGYRYNWPWLGPLVGFRISKDFGKTWEDCPHTPINPLFGETGECGYPVKVGKTHFVDFGKNMEHSPDGKAYLAGQGSDLKFYPVKNFPHLTWCTGDQIYMIRVTPTPENINDPKAYEFFAGHDASGNAVWTNDFTKIRPIMEWQDNLGCVSMTYNPRLKKYLTTITNGVTTCGKMHTFILESDNLTGPWKLISYMKDFGEQAYYVNIPSKFISEDGKKMHLFYSGAFARDWNGIIINENNPPGSHYGLAIQQIELI